MNDIDLAGTWVALEPNPLQRRRIEVRLHEWLDARDTSLTAEWLGLLKINPIAGLSFAAAAAGLVLIATPLSWVVFAVL